jgi:hypothetical protein
MMRGPRIWRFRHYVLTGTIRHLGSRERLLLTLTDAETGAVVWSDRLSSPFDALVDGFDDLAAKLARSDQTEVGLPKAVKPVGARAREQREQAREARETTRQAHNLIMKSVLTRGERDAV